MPYYIPSTGFVTLTRAQVAATADGDNVIVFAVATKQIVVVRFRLTATAAGLATLKDSAATVLDRIHFAVGVPVRELAEEDERAFATAVGEGLIITTQAGQDVYGVLDYAAL